MRPVRINHVFRSSSPLSSAVCSLAGAALLVSACGGAGEPPPRAPGDPPQATTAPQEDAAKAQKSPPAPPGAYPAPPGGYPAPPAASPVAQPSAPAAGVSAQPVPLLQLHQDFDRTEAQLAAQLSDCGAACRSLGALERTAAQLCELAREAKEQSRCDDARRRVALSRSKVRASCKLCPDGPPLDGAP